MKSRLNATSACLLCALLGCAGCALREGATPGPTTVAQSPEGAATTAPAEQDERLLALHERRAKLAAMLGKVEQTLQSASQRPPATAKDDERSNAPVQRAAPAPGLGESSRGLPDDVLELLERRLVITIALGWMEQQIRRRRFELGMAPPAGSQPIGSPPLEAADRWTARATSEQGFDPARADVAALLQQAELELDEARRRQRARASADDGRWRDHAEAGTSSADVPADGVLQGLLGAGRGGGGGLDSSPGASARPAKDKKQEERRATGKRGPARVRGGRGKSGERRGDPSAAVVGKGGLLFAEGGEGGGDEEELSEEPSRQASVVAHGAPPAGVMAAVRKQLGSMLACIPASLQAQGPVRFRVRARLGADGQLHEPVVRSGGLLPPDSVGCLTEVLVQVRVPTATDGASRIIGFPVWLTAPE